jgi:predicted Zn-dependent peptidase
MIRADDRGENLTTGEGTIGDSAHNSTVVERRTLANGARVVTEEIPWVESVSIGFFFMVGSAYESRKLNGMSHFLEHLVFKGSDRRSARDIVRDIESLGGVINAATGKEFTNFYCRIYYEHLSKALDVLADLIFKPAFPPLDIEREKLVIIEEIKMGEDNPDEYIVDHFYRNVYGDSPLGRRITGTSQSVSAFTRDELTGFHRKHLRPSNLVISASGKLNADDFCKLLESKFREVDAWSDARSRKVGIRIKPKYDPARFLLRRDVEQTTLILGFPSVSVLDPDRYAFAILDSYLAGGMSSKLFQEVREKRGLVYSIDTTQAPMSATGLYTIDGGMAGVNAPKVALVVGRILRQLKEKGIPARGFKNAKEYIKGVMLLGLESSIARMSRNAVGEVYHRRYLPVSELISRLEEVTRDQIKELANRIFDNDKLAVGILTSNAKEDEDEDDSLLDAVIDSFLKA